MAESESFVVNGVKYTKRPDNKWYGSNGDVISAQTANNLRPGNGDDAPLKWTNPKEGTVYERVDGKTWRNLTTGKSVSATTIEYLGGPSAGGTTGEMRTQMRELPDGRTILVNMDTGETIREISGPTPQAAPRDTNLGNGVYENSQGEFYVLDTVYDELGGQGQRRRIITQAEKQRLVDPQADATAQGNLSARWAELQQQIAQADAELQEQIRQNRIAEAQELANYDFLVKKERFAESQDNKRLANETAAQIFNQEQMIANLQMQGLQMQVEQQNLQMQAQMEVDSFNSQMGFSVAQANQQAAAQKREELAQSARDISGFSQSPTDWGRLAAFETAGRVWGDEDQAIREEGGFITDKSLQPLAQGLDNRDRIIATPDNPFSFTPIQAPTFQPFELPQLPTPTIAPVATPEAAPAAASAAAPAAAEATPAASGWQQDASGKWVGPQTGIGGVLDVGRLAKMEHGGVAQGAYIAGDSSDGKENEEINIPLGPGQALVISSKKVGPKAFAAIKRQLSGAPRMQNGGVFDAGLFGGGMDTGRARQFQSQAAQRQRMGTPWTTGPLPGATFASSPGLPLEVQQLLASMRGLEYGENPSYFLNRAQMLRPAATQERVISRTG